MTEQLSISPAPDGAEESGLDTALFDQNLRAFEEHLPAVAGLIRDLKARGTVSRVVGSEEGGDLNIDLGHALLYAEDAQTFAAKQVDLYLESPTRFTSAKYTPVTEATIATEHLIKDITEKSGLDLAGLPRDPDPGGGYLIVYGVGLGYHIDALVDALEFRSLVLLEQYEEFIYHSMYFQDWRRWFEELLARKGHVILLLGSEPDTMANTLYSSLRKQQFGLVDGSYLLKHYKSYFVDETDALFKEKTPVLGASPGFYEDERTMLHNCFWNLQKYPSYLFYDRSRLVKECPVFVIGSGPSADQAIDLIKKYKDRAVLITCGTALEVMLRNGLKPDFHAELDNTTGPRDIIAGLAKEYDLSGITLFASTTVHPDVPALFDRRIFFFRDTTCSTQFFSGPGEEVFLATTTVTNTGCRLGLGLGFRELFLIGTDLGTRVQGQHHSKNTIYYTDEEFLETHPDHLAQTRFPLQVPANLGGDAWTNHSFLLSRAFFTMLIPAYPVSRVYNCSDGALIPGAIPKLAHTVELTSTSDDKRKALDTVFKELKELEPGYAIDAMPLTLLQDAIRTWFAQLKEAVDRYRDGKDDIYALYDAVVSLIPPDGADAVPRTLYQLNIGSVMIGFQFALNVVRRLPEERREAFRQVFCEHYRHCLEGIETDAVEFMNTLIDAT